MARTKTEIFDEMIELKEADSVLSTILTSNSKASFYQSLFALFADVVGDFELTFDDFEDTLDDLLDTKQVHTSYWWRTMSLAFQYGDALSVQSNGNLDYDTEDTTKQIIQRAAVAVTDAGAIRLKVAALDSSDEPTPLSTAQKTAFSSYVNDAGPAGISVTIISVEGDEVKVGVDVSVDSQVINVTDGSSLGDSSTFPVEDAINDYFESFQGDDFGGVFYSNKLLQAILEVDGVTNATFSLLSQQASGESEFTDVLTTDGKKFTTYSGYVRLADGFSLSENITYESDE